MEKLRQYRTILMVRFGHDNLIALATTAGEIPQVRAVNAYCENGAFYIITYAQSAKTAQLAKNPNAAVCGDWFSAHGIGENLGWVRLPENAVTADKLRVAFTEWYDNGHVSEADENTVILRIRLTDGILFHHGTRYEIDFTDERSNAMQLLNLTPAEIFASCKQMGRISLTDDGILTDWSAAGFSVNVRANSIVLDFAPYQGDQPAYVGITVDGVKQMHALSDCICRIVVPMTDGVHTVTVLRMSEGGALYCKAVRLSTPFGGEAPALLPPPAKKSRRIVFFGDSITCGFGNLGDLSCPYLTSEQDPTAAYAYRCAELMGADAELVSISGQGIVRDCAGNVGIPIPKFFCWQSRCLRTPHAYPDDADIVVINAGTNDNGGGVTDEEFHDGAKAFLENLRAHYPTAKLVWYYGLMGLRYDAVLRALEGELAETPAAFTYLSVRPIAQEAGEVGACWHPTVEGDERGAAELAAALWRMM